MKLITFVSAALTLSTLVSAVPSVEERDEGIEERHGPGNGHGHGNRCRNPRVRKEWRQLSRRDKKGYISAMKCLTTKPRASQSVPVVGNSVPEYPRLAGTSLYDDFVWSHMDQAYTVHFNSVFLPWHRIYLWAFEQALRDECGYRGPFPYWDWTNDYLDLSQAPVFSSDLEVGFGGDGVVTPDGDNVVADGAFKDTTFSYPFPHKLRRNFNNNPNPDDPTTPANIELNPTYIQSVIDGTPGDFIGLNRDLAREWPSCHDAVHFFMGGDLFGQCPVTGSCLTTGPGTHWTPNEPLFYMHHTMVDRIWALWQERRPQNKYNYGGSLNGFLNPTPPLGDATPETVLSLNNLIPDVKVKDILNTKNDFLCYKYE